MVDIYEGSGKSQHNTANGSYNNIKVQGEIKYNKMLQRDRSNHR